MTFVVAKTVLSVDQVNALKHKNFLPTNDPMLISGGAAQRGQEGGLNKAVSIMSIPRIQASPQSKLPFGEEVKPSFRTKTAATRLTPDELAEIETAAEGAGQAVSEWLRETALCSARQRPADPAELVLAEVWALRYALLNLFHTAAQAASEGKQLLPDSILKIRDQADARKLQQARKLLEDFFASEGKERGHLP
jgi:hypothetical protein